MLASNNNSDKFKYSENQFLSGEIDLTGYILKVGKKGELYTPKKLRIKLGFAPGNEIIAVVKGDELLLKKRKTIVDLLDEDAVAEVSEKEIKEERKILEKELLER